MKSFGRPNLKFLNKLHESISYSFYCVFILKQWNKIAIFNPFYTKYLRVKRNLVLRITTDEFISATKAFCCSFGGNLMNDKPMNGGVEGEIKMFVGGFLESFVAFIFIIQSHNKNETISELMVCIACKYHVPAMINPNIDIRLV
ncbi:CLUMA_CG018322, isoform A [Clunio marinus]|uniref:CLUMA_CG018322, isoform A n=1 Tax=Clunio marinus TaxID=568069 RepID=A0A1J1IYJ2_9DIPT|nr:CLUMA_CG018322, isoform A [Clunio marinus]